MNADDLDIFIEKSNLIKLNLDKFNSDNDDINKKRKMEVKTL